MEPKKREGGGKGPERGDGSVKGPAGPDGSGRGPAGQEGSARGHRAVNERTLSRHELIGLQVQVVRSADPALAGTGGVVVDETRNMLVVRRAGGARRIRVPKEGATFRFSLPGGRSAELEGTSIMFRPEDRVKRCR